MTNQFVEYDAAENEEREGSMALRHAVLAALLDGEYSGYQLAKAFDIGVANFCHALPQQLYAELAKLEKEGLVSGRQVVQETRPNKRLFRVTDAGRAELEVFAETAAKPSFIRDDLLVKVQVADRVGTTRGAGVSGRGEERTPRRAAPATGRRRRRGGVPPPGRTDRAVPHMPARPGLRAGAPDLVPPDRRHPQGKAVEPCRTVSTCATSPWATARPKGSATGTTPSACAASPTGSPNTSPPAARSSCTPTSRYAAA